MNFEKLWKEHKEWLRSGVTYYTEVLENFETAAGTEYDKVANQLATYEFQLDKLDREERLEEKKAIKA